MGAMSSSTGGGGTDTTVCNAPVRNYVDVDRKGGEAFVRSCAGMNAYFMLSLGITVMVVLLLAYAVSINASHDREPLLPWPLAIAPGVVGLVAFFTMEPMAANNYLTAPSTASAESAASAASAPRTFTAEQLKLADVAMAIVRQDTLAAGCPLSDAERAAVADTLRRAAVVTTSAARAWALNLRAASSPGKVGCGAKRRRTDADAADTAEDVGVEGADDVVDTGAIGFHAAAEAADMTPSDMITASVSHGTQWRLVIERLHSFKNFVTCFTHHMDMVFCLLEEDAQQLWCITMPQSGAGIVLGTFPLAAARVLVRESESATAATAAAASAAPTASVTFFPLACAESKQLDSALVAALGVNSGTLVVDLTETAAVQFTATDVAAGLRLEGACSTEDVSADVWANTWEMVDNMRGHLPNISLPFTFKLATLSKACDSARKHKATQVTITLRRQRDGSDVDVWHSQLLLSFNTDTNRQTLARLTSHRRVGDGDVATEDDAWEPLPRSKLAFATGSDAPPVVDVFSRVCAVKHLFDLLNPLVPWAGTGTLLVPAAVGSNAPLIIVANGSGMGGSEAQVFCAVAETDPA